MAKDLRSFIEELGSDLLTVEREVDPVNEVAELSSKAPGPIMFRGIKGYPSWRIVDGLVRTRKRQALEAGVRIGNCCHGQAMPQSRSP